MNVGGYVGVTTKLLFFYPLVLKLHFLAILKIHSVSQHSVLIWECCPCPTIHSHLSKGGGEFKIEHIWDSKHFSSSMNIWITGRIICILNNPWRQQMVCKNIAFFSISICSNFTNSCSFDWLHNKASAATSDTDFGKEDDFVEDGYKYTDDWKKVERQYFSMPCSVLE